MDIRQHPIRSRLFNLYSILLLGIILSGCSPKQILYNQLSSTFDSVGSVYMTENDPELVREAFPFNLKTIDILISENPESVSLLTLGASSYTMYAYAFIMEDADRTIVDNYTEGRELYHRAQNLFQRAFEYGLQGLRQIQPDIASLLINRPTSESYFTSEDVPLLYWTGAALGGTISASQADPLWVIRLPELGWLFQQALNLQPDWNDGALYSAMISYSTSRVDYTWTKAEEQARHYFDLAMSASQGSDASLYVTRAEAITIHNQNRDEFRSLLQSALQIDVDEYPQKRLSNILAQSRAEWLLSREEELFYE